VIPPEAKERIILERETFLSAVRRVSLLASETSWRLRLKWAKGREFGIAFNPEFLMAPLRNLSEDEIYLDLIDEMSPGVIKIAGPFLCVLMTMRF
jgi:DNA polymerase-3 subunit beta